MTRRLTELEINAMRVLAGRLDPQAAMWGRELVEAVKRLHGLGYAAKEPCNGGTAWIPTDAGLALLDEMEGSP